MVSKLRSVVLIALSVFNLSVAAAPYELRINQRNGTDTATFVTNIVPTPNTDGIMIYNGSTNIPVWGAIGTGLAWSGTTLTATGGSSQVQTDWNETTGLGVILNKPSLSTVATSGNYSDLSGRPSLFSGDYLDLTNKPSLFDGSYNSLSSVPSTFAPSSHTHPASEINDSTSVGRAVLTAANATLARGAIGAGTSSFDGAYSSLSSIPSTFTPSAHNQAFSTITSTPTTISGYGITDVPATARTAISLTTTGTSGSATYNSSTGVLNVPVYAAPIGTVTSVGVTSSNLTVTGSPVTSSGSIAVSIPATTINDSPSRSLVATTASTGFQISSTQKARVCYEGSIATTSTIGGASAATVFLETADTNSTTPGDWTTKASQTYSNNITLAIVLNQSQGNNFSMCRTIPAGKYVRIRSGSVTGTASVTLTTQQEETIPY